MIKYQNEIIVSAIVLISLAIIWVIFRFLIRRFVRFRAIDANRRKIVLNLGYSLILLTACLSAAAIWGFGIEDFAFFASSVLAVVGIGFFAQWSILSNLTASVILFFNHPMRLGDQIRIMEKDYEQVGVVTDITGFYLHMRTEDGRYLTFPTSLIIQKGVEIVAKAEDLQ